VLREYMGRWKYDATTQELWLADDQVRDQCQDAFDDVRVASLAFANLRAINESGVVPNHPEPTPAMAEAGEKL
jgi:hypothetical protein